MVHSKKISNDQELIQSDPISFPQNQKYHQGSGILKSDCKQSLRIGIIRALNKCTGRLFRTTIRHNHKSSDMQSKKISNYQELIQSDPMSTVSTLSVCFIVKKRRFYGRMIYHVIVATEAIDLPISYCLYLVFFAAS